MRWIGWYMVQASSAETMTMPTPAGHHTANAVRIDSVATASDWAIRTPPPRNCEPTSYTSLSIRSSSSPTGVFSSAGRSCPKATRFSPRRHAAAQSAVRPAATSPTTTSVSTDATSASASRTNNGIERSTSTAPASASAPACPAEPSTMRTATSAVRRGDVAHRSRSRRIDSPHGRGKGRNLHREVAAPCAQQN
jgi:hypothetical protein